MEFTTEDLRCMGGIIRTMDAREHGELLAMLRRRQPAVLRLLDDVARDPRCAEAYRFATLTFALAIWQADAITGRPLPRLSADEFRVLACGMARGPSARSGDRARTYPLRVGRHVIPAGEFDEEDAGWLCMVIPAFLVLVERATSSAGRPPAGGSIVRGGVRTTPSRAATRGRCPVVRKGRAKAEGRRGREAAP